MHQKPCRMLQPLLIPNRPWQDIAIDFIVKLPPSKDFLKPKNPKYDLVWVVVDRFTKMVSFLPYKKNTGADILARGFLKDIFANHGFSQSIVSDKGIIFAAKFTRALYKTLDVKKNLSLALHLQTKGQTERTNQMLEQYLRMYCYYLQDDWVNLLPIAFFAYNNRISVST